MRGKDLPLVLAHNEAGITPAHAGKSLIETGDLAKNEDHPRTCGEKQDSEDLPFD